MKWLYSSPQKKHECGQTLERVWRPAKRPDIQTHYTAETYPSCLVFHEDAVGDVSVLREVFLDVLLGNRLILQPFK